MREKGRGLRELPIGKLAWANGSAEGPLLAEAASIRRSRLGDCDNERHSERRNNPYTIATTHAVAAGITATQIVNIS